MLAVPEDCASGMRFNKQLAAVSNNFKTGARRVVVTAGAAKARGRGAAAAPAVGRAARVVNLDGHGWAVVQALDTGERLRLQQRFLAHAHGGELDERAAGAGAGIGGQGSPTSCTGAGTSRARAGAHRRSLLCCDKVFRSLVCHILVCQGSSRFQHATLTPGNLVRGQT